MAVFATSVLCLGVQRCLRTPRPTALAAGVSVVFLLVMTALGGLGAVPWSARQMVVMYSFTWVGFTIGAIPSGRLLRDHLEAERRQPGSEAPAVPARYVVFMVMTVSLMLLLAYALAV
ncbi:hypothetical protein ACFXB4_29040 [Streptomyces lavendulae]|uniref:hypothetical protein n=1 Tax=Streptomyces lavendulae TaxID=1914 RepID=UPI0024A076DD|nr:hypothetical protein Sros01_81320 [Streptomyces roseochromogenus]